MNTLLRIALLVGLIAGWTTSTAQADTSSNLVAYWPFTQGSGADASGNGFPATLNNTTSVEDRFSSPASALNFNGTTSSAEVGTTFALANQQTFSAWIKPASIGSNHPILEKAVSGFGGELDCYLYLLSDGRVSWEVNTNNGSTGLIVTALSTTAIPAGQWTLITGVIDQATDQVRVYVNGVLEGTSTMAGRSVRNTNRPFRMGRRIGSQATQTFNGTIDEVRVYDRTLTDSEIAALYHTIAGYDPVWAEEFGGTALDPEVWTLRTGDSCIISDGTAKITSSLNWSGIVSSIGKRSITSNDFVIEFRARRIGPYDVALALTDGTNSVTCMESSYGGNTGLVLITTGDFGSTLQTNGLTTESWKEYRLICKGNTVTLLRGDSLSSQPEILSQTLNTTFDAHNLHLTLNNGGNNTAEFDWIRLYEPLSNDPLVQDLSGWWNYSDFSASALPDRTIHATNAQISGTPERGTAGLRPGVILNPVGNADRISIPLTSATTPPNIFTVVALIRPDELADSGTFFSGPGFAFSPGNLAITGTHASHGVLTYNYPVGDLTIGKWAHLILTMEAKPGGTLPNGSFSPTPWYTAVLYVDGVKTHDFYGLLALDLSVRPWDIFNRVSFRDLRLWKRDLSPTEATQLFAEANRGMIRGTVTCEQWREFGSIVVKVTDGTEERFRVLQKPGPYEIPVPLDVDYSVSAFWDIDGDGFRRTSEPLGTCPTDPIFAIGDMESLDVTIPVAQDLDNDLMPDAWEETFGLDLNANDAFADLNSDGLPNLYAFLFSCDPRLTDTDLDGISDVIELFELGSLPRSIDSDGDGMPDAWERLHGLNPLVNDADLDADGDGLTNIQEYNGGVDSTNPRSSDSDGNGISDHEERLGSKNIAHRYDRADRLVTTVYSNGAWEGWRYDGNGNILRHLLRANRDADSDGLPDDWEFAQGLDFDSSAGSQGYGGDADGDGWTNQQEFLADSEPNDDSSAPPAGEGSTRWATPPKSRIIFPASRGGALAHVSIRIWDAEANRAQATLEWWDAATNLWKPATLSKVNLGAITHANSLTTSPSGVTHDFLWNALVDLPNHNSTILLRSIAEDPSGTTTSETVPYALNTAGDFDGDGIPDAFEIANGLDPNSASGADGATADVDNDGYGNLAEFAFNMDPRRSDATKGPLSSTAVNPADGKAYLTFSYRKRLDAATLNLIYTVQTSTDLGEWASTNADIELIGSTPTGDGVTETVTVRIKPSLDTPNGKKFVRVRISYTPE